jgi:hypothetical protein
MRLRSLIVLPLLLSYAVPALAQGTAPDLASAVSLVEADLSVSRVIEADLNVDGRPEALLIHDAGCEAGGCPWTLVGAYPDAAGWGPVAAGFGAVTDLVETVPSGHVIRSDGVVMSWDGAVLRPYYDLLDRSPDRRAEAGETRILGRLVPGSFRPISTRAHDLDPFGLGETWRLFSVLPSEGSESALTRAYLLGPDETVRWSGASFDRVWVYADQDGVGPVLRLVSLTGDGMIVEGVR